MRSVALVIFFLSSLFSISAAGIKPNVIFILADDLGYGEIEALNPDRSKIPTPNLNQLAADGCIFTDAHSSSSVCSPTRYSLLTGRYNWRTRLQAGVLTGDDDPLIATGRLTLGNLFQQQGYSTAIFGKWHLNYKYELPEELRDAPKPKKTKTRYPAPFPVGTRVIDGPLTRGFDTFYGFHHSRTMSSFVRDDKIVEEVDIVDVLPSLTDRVVQYIEGQAEGNPSKPFFLYFAMSSPHTPIVPADAWKGKGKIGKYADFVAQTDGSVGQVIHALESHGLAENTIVIFSSDNGTSKAAGIPKMESQGHFPSADLRGSKSDLWDGGHRVPFIVRWPGRLKGGTTCDQLICLSDMMATFAEMFGFDLNDETAEDSTSFLPALYGRKIPDVRTTIVHHSVRGKFSIRQGDWKLLLTPGSGGWSSPQDQAAVKQGLPEAQLYNLQAEVGEQTNLVEKYPKKMAALIGLLEEIVANGRSTPGETQANDVEVDIWKRPAS